MQVVRMQQENLVVNINPRNKKVYKKLIANSPLNIVLSIVKNKTVSQKKCSKNIKVKVPQAASFLELGIASRSEMPKS